MMDFKMIPKDLQKELEENKAVQVDWLDKAWWLTPKQKYEQMGLEIPDYLNTEDLEKLYLPNNIAPVDDFAPMPVPNGAKVQDIIDINNTKK